ncbi:hypothetical protein NQZ68_028958 [Dissostichus eleginoides]|nr:hypothetical protein NQZ68_028958 [Dissostichus eleginoides]
MSGIVFLHNRRAPDTGSHSQVVRVHEHGSRSGPGKHVSYRGKKRTSLWINPRNETNICLFVTVQLSYTSRSHSERLDKKRLTKC